MGISTRAFKWIVGSVVAIIIALFVFISIAERIPEGHVAVVYTPSKGAKDVLNPGFHWVGLLDKTYQVSVRPEVIDTKVEVNTSDGKKITIPVTYNMEIASSKDSILRLFKAHGARGEKYYSETIIQQQLRRISKETIAKYSTLDIFTTKLTESGNTVGEVLADKMEPKGFIIADLALLSPEIDEKTSATIDAQIQAQQANELKKLELANDTIEQQRIQQAAEADQNKRKTDADTKAYETTKAATAAAESNKKIAASLTEPILKKMELEARQKHGWVEIQGANAIIEKK